MLIAPSNTVLMLHKTAFRGRFMTEEAFHRLALLAGLRPGRTVLALRDVLLHSSTVKDAALRYGLTPQTLRNSLSAVRQHLRLATEVVADGWHI